MKYIQRLLQFGFILWLVTACRHPIAVNSLLDQVIQAGELRVGTTGDYQPYSHLLPSGQYEGIDIALAKDLAQSLGVKLVLVPTSWPTLMTDLKANKYDIGMSGISKKLSRQAQGLFSRAYTISGKTPIARCEDQDKFNSLEDINQKDVKVIVNPGGTNEVFAKEHITEATLILHPENTTIFQAIIAGEADVMITDQEEVLLQSATSSKLCPCMPGKTFNQFEKAYLLPRDLIWKAYVDEWLQQRQLEGTVDAIFQSFLGKSAD